jgi:hypothetical protein
MHGPIYNPAHTPGVARVITPNKPLASDEVMRIIMVAVRGQDGSGILA